jgi:hypothetical protein
MEAQAVSVWEAPAGAQLRPVSPIDALEGFLGDSRKGIVTEVR